MTHSGDHRRRAEGAAKHDVFLSNTKLFHAEISLTHSSKLIPTVWSPSVVGERRGSGADSYRKSPDASHHSAAKAIFASLFSAGYTRPGRTQLFVCVRCFLYSKPPHPHSLTLTNYPLSVQQRTNTYSALQFAESC